MEHPILFSAPMVRAILEGRKTQTRRVIKPQPALKPTGGFRWGESGGKRIPRGPRFCSGGPAVSLAELIAEYCPYGRSGDRLWVRETWQRIERLNSPTGVMYAATHRGDPPCEGWRPSIFMPHWASRITLELTAVRCERLQDISEEDAIVEGCNKQKRPDQIWWQGYDSRVPDVHGNLHHVQIPCLESPPDWLLEPKRMVMPDFLWQPPVMQYQLLWNSINGKKFPWKSNPWVWVLSFRRLTPKPQTRRE